MLNRLESASQFCLRILLREFESISKEQNIIILEPQSLVAASTTKPEVSIGLSFGFTFNCSSSICLQLNN